jgi:glycerol transport system ATP-binding protein
MAEIRLRQLAHSYSRQPASEADYALHALEHVDCPQEVGH